MAFKLKGWNAGEGTGSSKKFIQQQQQQQQPIPNQGLMGATSQVAQSPMMKWEDAVERSEGEINKWVAERKKIKNKYKGTSNPKGYKDDPAYQAVQNKINKAYKSDKRHGKTTTESKDEKGRNVKTINIPGESKEIKTTHRDKDSKFGKKTKTKIDYVDTPMEDDKSLDSKYKETKGRYKTKDEHTKKDGEIWETKRKGYKNKDGKWVRSKWKRDFGDEKGFFGKGRIKYKAARGEDLKDNMVKKYKRTIAWDDSKEKIKHRGKGIEYGGIGWYGAEGSKRKQWEEKDGVITKTKQKWDTEADDWVTTKTKTRKKGGTGIGAKIKEKLKNRKDKKNKNK